MDERLEFSTWYDQMTNCTFLRIHDNQGSHFVGEHRYVVGSISDMLLVSYGSVEEVWVAEIQTMVREFNKHGRKIKVVPHDNKTYDPKVLTLPYGIGLMYWSDVDGTPRADSDA